MTLTGQPDGWFKIGNPTLAPADSGGFGEQTGGKILSGTFAPTEGIGQYLGVLTAGGTTGLGNEELLVRLVRGCHVCAYIYAALDSTSPGSELTLTIGDYDGTTAYETDAVVIPPKDELHRFSLYHNVRLTANQVYFKIYNDTAAELIAYLNNAMFHAGEFPLQFRPSTGWGTYKWEFGHPGPAAETGLHAGIVPAGKYHVDAGDTPFLVPKLTVHALTPPSGGANKFAITADTTAGLEITLPDGEASAEAHITDYTDPNGVNLTDVLAASCTQTHGAGNEAADINLTAWALRYDP